MSQYLGLYNYSEAPGVDKPQSTQLLDICPGRETRLQVSGSLQSKESKFLPPNPSATQITAPGIPLEAQFICLVGLLA